MIEKRQWTIQTMDDILEIMDSSWWII
jgi:hypothetical protein